MRLQIIISIALSFVVLIFGCSTKVSLDEVVGIYAVRYPYGNESLQLYNDGTYTQVIRIDGESNAKESKGRWEFDKDESKVILSDAIIVDDGFGKLKPNYRKLEPGLWILSAKKSFGKISLSFNPDQGFFFKKTRDVLNQ